MSELGKRGASLGGESAHEKLKRIKGDDKTYLKHLQLEQQKLEPFVASLPLVAQLLQFEIDMIASGKSRYGASHKTTAPGVEVTRESEEVVGKGQVKATMRITVPTDLHPSFNFIGRLLGPRGMTLKELQHDSGTKMSIRGKGSMKVKQGESLEDLKKQHTHLDEPLHVLVEYNGKAEFKEEALRLAEEAVVPLLIPPTDDNNDMVKRKQLEALAMMNGTFKDPKRGHREGYDRGGAYAPYSQPPPASPYGGYPPSASAAYPPSQGYGGGSSAGSQYFDPAYDSVGGASAYYAMKPGRY